MSTKPKLSPPKKAFSPRAISSSFKLPMNSFLATSCSSPLLLHMPVPASNTCTKRIMIEESVDIEHHIHRLCPNTKNLVSLYPKPVLFFFFYLYGVWSKKMSWIVEWQHQCIHRELLTELNHFENVFSETT